MKLKTILILSLFFLTGCNSATNTQPKTILDSDKSLAPEVLKEKNQQVQYFVNYKPQNLPDEALSEAVQSTYELNDALFVFAFSTSTRNPKPSVLLSTDRGKNWKTFFTPSSLFKQKIPIGLFTVDGKLFVDEIKKNPKNGDTIFRYTSEDVGQTWNEVGYFEFNQEEYFVNGEDMRKGIKITL